jgi:hypothetical protein
VAFKREPGEELPTMLFCLQGLALVLEKALSDQELVVKFVTALDRWLRQQTSTQAMASTLELGGTYTLDEAYEAGLMVSAANSRLSIARELLPRAGGTVIRRAPDGVPGPQQGLTWQWQGAPSGWQGGLDAYHSCSERTQAPMAAAAAPLGGPGGSGACHSYGELGNYKSGCPHRWWNSSGRGQGGSDGRGGGEDTQSVLYGVRELYSRDQLVCQEGDPGGSSGGYRCCMGEMRSVGSAVFQAFEEWRAMTTAMATSEAEGTEEDGEWDDQDYALGAVALRVGQGAVLSGSGTLGRCRDKSRCREGKGHKGCGQEGTIGQ